MKKVAILSLYYKSINYGGLLQSYALQKKVEALGFDCKQISYDLYSGYGKKLRILRKIFWYIRNVSFFNLRWFLKRRKFILKQENFAKNIPHTMAIKNSNLSILNKNFDIFICGSDQIWNPVGWQPALFLNFVNSGKRKIAYAASISKNSLTDNEINYIKKYTKDFFLISLREENLIDILNSKLDNKKICLMPDPSFLLGYEDWISISRKDVNNEINCNYILAYILGDNLLIRDDVIRFANKNNMRVFFVPFMNTDKKVINWEINNSKYVVYSLGVENFLELLRNANCIVTDSFHATVFSIIFKRPFFVFGRSIGATKQSMNSRVNSLLETFHLENRFVRGDLCECKVHEFSEEMKLLINSKLKELKDKGSKFLVDSLKNSNLDR